MIAATYHAGRCKHWRGIYIQDLDPQLLEQCAADPTLRCMWDSVRPSLEGVMSDSMTAADAAMEAQISAEACLEG